MTFLQGEVALAVLADLAAEVLAAAAQAEVGNHRKYLKISLLIS